MADDRDERDRLIRLEEQVRGLREDFREYRGEQERRHDSAQKQILTLADAISQEKRSRTDTRRAFGVAMIAGVFTLSAALVGLVGLILTQHAP